MQDEELLSDIMILLEDKNINQKEKFIRQNKELLDLSIDDIKLGDKLCSLDEDLERIINKIKLEEKDFKNMHINSERSNNSTKQVNKSNKNVKNDIKRKDINKGDDRNNDIELNENYNKANNDFKLLEKSSINQYFSMFGNENNNESNNYHENSYQYNNNNNDLIVDKVEEERKTKHKRIFEKLSENIIDHEDIEIKLNSSNKDSNKPVFTIGHKLKRKNLDNSFDDKKELDQVNTEGLEEFKSIVKLFFIQKLKKNVEQTLFNYKEIVKQGLTDCVDDIKLDEWLDVFNFLLNEEENFDDEKKDKKEKKGFFACFSCGNNKQSNESKLKFDLNYDLKLEAVNLYKEMKTLKNEITDLIQSDNIECNEESSNNGKKNNKEYKNRGSQEKKNNNEFQYNKVNYNSQLSELMELKELKNYLDNLVEEKYHLLYKEQDFEGFLKQEVDRFSEYFNIDIILKKQEERLKLQKQKISQLEEFKVLNECIVCMENSRNVAFLPCLHFICCDSCAFGKIGAECPQCHGIIENKRIIIV